jgi:hypothetical protein
LCRFDNFLSGTKKRASCSTLFHFGHPGGVPQPGLVPLWAVSFHFLFHLVPGQKVGETPKNKKAQEPKLLGCGLF